MIVPAMLLVVFLVHLAAFAVLGLRRRQLYYLSLVTTFALLSASMAVRLFSPEVVVGGELELATALRAAAWAAAAVSIGWTLTRVSQRRLARR